MHKTLAKLRAALIITASAACLMACTSDVPAFDRLQGEDDVLSVEVAEGVRSAGGLPESSRMFGTSADGNRYFVTAREIEGYCLVIVGGNSMEDWVVGCERNFPVIVGMGDQIAALFPYGSPMIDRNVEVIADQIVLRSSRG